ncbi:unnamed protein product [Cyprideis torosa]|uniref:Uncharacterized protein n=1 Tax=Cyprideis torosa TaxID=163714 RepID=A0A7R8WGD6_9CRUS|nr:unnamed protein product [Cyprideis torosa]CAG0898047.1 unnamed protein product [Cyprideis torosa]
MSRSFEKLHPLDAGTDQGLTFTSPNWAQKPLEAITEITASHPSHPASSFYYPEKTELPPIASITIKKITEPNDQELPDEAATTTPENVKKQRRKYTMLPLVAASSVTVNPRKLRVSTSVPSTTTESSLETTVISQIPARASAYRRGRGGRSGRRRRRLHTKVLQRGAKLRATKRTESQHRDCQVSEWSVWSKCNRGCGIGEKFRTRLIMKPAKGGGAQCPPLVERGWCGSSRGCEHHKYFNWQLRRNSLEDPDDIETTTFSSP